MLLSLYISLNTLNQIIDNVNNKGVIQFNGIR